MGLTNLLETHTHIQRMPTYADEHESMHGESVALLFLVLFFFWGHFASNQINVLVSILGFVFFSNFELFEIKKKFCSIILNNNNN